MLNGKFLVVGVKRGKGEFDGKKWENTKLICIEHVPENDENKKGFTFSELKGTYELFDFIKTVPAVYEMDLEFLYGNMIVNNCKIVKEIKLEW